MNNAYVYRHRRLDNNQVFYVGIGKAKNYSRAYIKKRRNNFWKSIINKTNYTIEIIAKNLSWSDACELEEFLINIYGRRDLKKGNLVNLTNGGDGGNGVIQSFETIQNRTKKITGLKRTNEVKLKLSLLATGRKHSDKSKLKISIASKNRKYSQETINKRKSKIIGIKYSDEVKLKMKENNWKSKKVINTLTNTVYLSISDAAKSINMSRMPLTRRLYGIIKNNTTLKLL